MTTLTCHPQNGVPKSGEFSGGKFWTLEFWGVASPGLNHFRGWLVQNSFFSGFWHIGKFGGGKKDETPCTMTRPDSPHTRPSGALNEYLKDYCLRFKKVLEQPGEEIVTPVRLFLV